jgi:hypothetical protein
MASLRLLNTPDAQNKILAHIIILRNTKIKISVLIVHRLSHKMKDVYINTRARAHTHTHTHIYIYIHAHTYIIHARTRTRTRTHTHKQTHTHTHTRTITTQSVVLANSPSSRRLGRSARHVWPSRMRRTETLM